MIDTFFNTLVSGELERAAEVVFEWKAEVGGQVGVWAAYTCAVLFGLTVAQCMTCNPGGGGVDRGDNTVIRAATRVGAYLS